MKKILTIIIIAIGYSSSLAFADELPVDTCAAILDEMQFATSDWSFRVTLWNNTKYNQIIGEVSTMVDNVTYTSMLSDSHCDHGKLTLKWSQPNFSGYLDGQVSVMNKGITHVSGIAQETNDAEEDKEQVLHDNLNFAGLH